MHLFVFYEKNRSQAIGINAIIPLASPNLAAGFFFNRVIYLPGQIAKFQLLNNRI